MHTGLMPAMPRTMPFREAALRLHPDDNVGIARQALAPGTVLGDLPLTLRDLVPAAHKLALATIPAGAPVLRYGHYIGTASRDIAAGEHVHLHNMAAGEHTAFTRPISSQATGQAGADSSTFMGFPRHDGRAGTRNYVAVITSVNCSAFVGRQIAAAFTPQALAAYPNVDGVIAFTHLSGCANQTNGADYVLLQRTLAGMARHPNIAGYMVVGLGCEVNQIPDWIANYGLTGADAPFASVTIQEAGGTQKTIEAGIRAVNAFLPAADAHVRRPVPVSALTLALQCGGSDGFSGVTANPLLGRVCDRLVALGGRVVLSETPEIYGAESLLLGRAASPRVADRLMETIRWWENHTARLGIEMNNNPSAGNKAGGLTTIYEKSLGAVAKGGSTPLNDVVGYAEPVTAPGLTFMDTPGYDSVSATGQVAGGCTLIAFTTGRGSVFGFRPAPSFKIATNSEMYFRMIDDMDFNAGALLDDDAQPDEAAEALFSQIIAVAGGARSKSEAQGIGADEFNPWNLGGTL
jgi:altronate hydrolase